MIFRVLIRVAEQQTSNCHVWIDMQCLCFIFNQHLIWFHNKPFLFCNNNRTQNSKHSFSKCPHINVYCFLNIQIFLYLWPWVRHRVSLRLAAWSRSVWRPGRGPRRHLVIYCVLFELNLRVIHHPGQFYNLMFYDTWHIKIYTGNENLKWVLGSLLRSIRNLCWVSEYMRKSWLCCEQRFSVKCT